MVGLTRETEQMKVALLLFPAVIAVVLPVSKVKEVTGDSLIIALPPIKPEQGI